MAQQNVNREARRLDHVRVKRTSKPLKRSSPRHFSLFRRRARNAIVAGGLVLVLGAVGQVSWSFFSEAPYFQLSRLQIEGVADPLATELKTTLEKAISENRNLLNLNLSGVEQLLAAHPRIQNFRFEKLYPDTLILRASEREPCAIASANGFYLIDREGSVIEKIKPASLRNYDFPYITGIDSDQMQPGEKICNSRLLRALDLIRVLRERNPDLYARFSEVNIATDPISHMDNLTAQLKGGVQVRFGEKNPIERLPSLELFIKMQQDQKLDPFAMAYIDLRFENQIVYMDRATAVAAAAGVLESVQQEQSDAAAKEQKKQDKNDQQNKSGSAVSKASDDDSQSDRPAPQIDKTRTDAETDQRTVAPRQSAVQAPAPVQLEPSQPAAQAKPRSRFPFAFWRRGNDAQQQPSGAPGSIGTR